LSDPKRISAAVRATEGTAARNSFEFIYDGMRRTDRPVMVRFAL